MGFLIEDDYKSQIREFDLDDLTDYSDDRRTDAELRAQAEMESYLTDRYNVGSIFSATGDDRNPLIVMYMIDVALYHLFCAIAPRNVPEIRIQRYRDVTKWLDKVRQGQLSPLLPANTDAQGKKLIDSVFGQSTRDGANW